MPGIVEIITIHMLITIIVVSIVTIVGLIGNSLMIRAWIKYRKLRTDFYTVFTFLAIADMMFLALNAPYAILDQLLLEEVVITTGYCKSMNYLINVSGFISTYLIVVLSVLRGILLTNRNTVSRPQAKHLIFICLAFYAIVFLSSIPIFEMYDHVYGVCEYSTDMNTISVAWLITAFAALLPLLLMIIIYLFTYLLGKRFFADSYSPRERGKSRLVSVIIIAFILCQIPYRIVTIYEAYNYLNFDDMDLFGRIQTAKSYMTCLLMADKAIRPVLYSKLANDLSEAFDEVINCKSCSKSYTVSPVLKSRRDEVNMVSNITCATFLDSPNSSRYDGASALPVSDRTLQTELDRSALIDRTISSSSSASATSQTPLTKPRQEEDIEMA